MTMTTGLLENLKSDYDYKRWLKEQVIRSFGICINMRDEGPLTQAEILEKLKERDADQLKYFQDKKAEYEAKIADLEAKLKTDLTQEALAAWDKKQESYIKAVTDAKKSIQEFEPISFRQSALIKELLLCDNDLCRSIVNTVQNQFKIQETSINDKLRFAEYDKPETTREQYPAIYVEDLKRDLDRYKKYLYDTEFDLESLQPLSKQYEEFCKAVDAIEV